MNNATVSQLPWATPRLALGAGLLATVRPQLFAALTSPLAPVRTRRRIRPFPRRIDRPNQLTLFPPSNPTATATA